MLTRKFYCHRCGEKLGRQTRKRMVMRGDPDYKNHSHHSMHTVGDIEVTEYDFFCSNCNQTTDYDKQDLIAYIQKKTGQRILAQSEIDAMLPQANAHMDKKATWGKILFWTIGIALMILVMYLQSRA